MCLLRRRFEERQKDFVQILDVRRTPAGGDDIVDVLCGLAEYNRSIGKVHVPAFGLGMGKISRCVHLAVNVVHVESMAPADIAGALIDTLAGGIHHGIVSIAATHAWIVIYIAEA